MTPITRRLRHKLCMASLAALPALLPATTALAQQQSQFGCSSYEFSSALPSVEGKDGVFYRTQTDLRMQHPMADQIVRYLAELSDVLEENGTTLIFVTLPSKSQGMPAYLPDHAADYGYDQGIVEAVYTDIITRLNANGIVAPDIMTALQGAKPGERVFFGTDFHWTPYGASLAAEAIGAAIKAQPRYAEVVPSQFVTEPAGVQTAFSGMRRTLQSFCVNALPPVETMSFKTTKVEATGDAAGGLDIFVNDNGGAQMVLLGTSFSDSTVNNFAGFLSQYSGLDVINYAITGGNQFGSITSYLTSTEFKEQKPAFLVWETPIYNSLGQYGSAQMEELIAAAGSTCTDTLDARHTADGKMTAELDGREIKRNDAVFVDFGSSGARRAKITLTTSDGITRTSEIERSDRLRATGRFYFGMSAFWLPEITSVAVEFDAPAPKEAQVALCHHQKGDAS